MLFGGGIGDGEVVGAAMERKEVQVLFVGCRLPSETLLRAPEPGMHFTFSIVGAWRPVVSDKLAARKKCPPGGDSSRYQRPVIGHAEWTVQRLLQC
jgi:hypothetical protein